MVLVRIALILLRLDWAFLWVINYDSNDHQNADSLLVEWRLIRIFLEFSSSNESCTFPKHLLNVNSYHNKTMLYHRKVKKCLVVIQIKVLWWALPWNYVTSTFQVQKRYFCVKNSLFHQIVISCPCLCQFPNTNDHKLVTIVDEIVILVNLIW